MVAVLLTFLAAFAAPALAATQYKFAVNMEGKKGEFTVEVHDDWAPLGAARFHELAAEPGFFDGVRFFRTVKGFMTQFGIPGKPAVAAAWKDKKIADDPVKECVFCRGVSPRPHNFPALTPPAPRRRSNLRGYITFATSGKDSRTTQMFINL
jgi:peptidyl-prolyl cis-trans isomerase A (cyclophilin A)